jgi:L-amino acid N-acyltransferase YncA
MTGYAELAKHLNEAVEDETKRGWRLMAAAAEAIEALKAENKQLLGTLEYIEAQARLGYPTVLSVIIANAKAARNREFQKAVLDAFAALERKPE